MDNADRHISRAELEARVGEIRAAFRAIGHPLTDEAGDRVRRLLSGDIGYEEAIDEIMARYSRTVAELAGDLAAAVFTKADFIEAAVNLPVVRQTPSPASQYSDSWIPVRGPIGDLHDAFSGGLINSELHDHSLVAMIAAGHEA
ncbi:antitoxin VbhA family protein [Cryobacterium sp. PH31-O1]|uniref:antitoxin VbhA family protein n=1 Tax=Cryobacterium sp. PH31-O1 TaxID=3046306 RepID=UPI0024B972C4|nr:antitoxin VbhA family protein [Cryobacterium sp. PH31-O1]MDJ0338680.1 antitoxin VbhA family protein [Cryobacterium sp. PH31-O1]